MHLSILWNLINVGKAFDILRRNKLKLIFICEFTTQRAWEFSLQKQLLKVLSESTLSSRKYLVCLVSTTVHRRQDGFKCILNLCFLWPRNYLAALIFTGLITPALKWGSSYLTTGHLGRSYFLMMCGMKWFGFYCFLPINSKSYPNYQGNKSLSPSFSLPNLLMDILLNFVWVGRTGLSFHRYNSPCLNWST